MNPAEFRLYAEIMKEYGIAFLRVGNIQVVMEKSRIIEKPEIAELEADPLKHKLNQMTSVMKLSDEELVDKLFPVDEDESA